MWQEQKTGSKREVRRKNISPVDILLGHKVKNFMTVIEGVPAGHLHEDGELSDSGIVLRSVRLHWISNLEDQPIGWSFLSYRDPATFFTQKFASHMIMQEDKKWLFLKVQVLQLSHQ